MEDLRDLPDHSQLLGELLSEERNMNEEEATQSLNSAAEKLKRIEEKLTLTKAKFREHQIANDELKSCAASLQANLEATNEEIERLEAALDARDAHITGTQRHLGSHDPSCGAPQQEPTEKHLQPAESAEAARTTVAGNFGEGPTELGPTNMTMIPYHRDLENSSVDANTHLAELAMENAQLKAMVDLYDAELDKSQRRVGELEAENRDLRAERAVGEGGV